MHTVPDLPVKYTGLLLYSDLYAAADSIVPLRTAGAKALEIMDRASLRSVENEPGIPAWIKTLPKEPPLLAQVQSAEESSRTRMEALAKDAVGGLKLFEPARFTHAAAEQALLWKIRAGMFCPRLARCVKSGTTVIIEDVAFPVEVLADATYDLNRLFVKHQYSNAIIYGRAKDEQVLYRDYAKL